MDTPQSQNSNPCHAYPEEFLRQLSEMGFPLSTKQLNALTQYLRLIQAYNKSVGVVSRQEVAHLWERHLVDSLSLLPVLDKILPVGGHHLDIGSGGGFPAIPLALMFQDRNFDLIERSSKKCGFLRKVVAMMSSENIQIHHGTFPELALGLRPGTITARAVEKPALIHKAIANFMAENTCFVAQCAPEAPLSSEMFHVEQYQDQMSARGWRRGDLFLVKRRTS